MTNEIRIVIQRFFQDLEEFELIKFPNPEFFPSFHRIRQNIEIDGLAQKGLLKILNVRKQLTHEQQGRFITDDQYNALEISSSISQLRVHTEELTSFLKSIIDPCKIDPTVTMLGRYLRLIYNQLQYNNPQRQQMNEILLVNLRNALNHNDYELRLDGFTYDFMSGNPINLDVQGLSELMKHQSIITNETIEYLRKHNLN